MVIWKLKMKCVVNFLIERERGLKPTVANSCLNHKLFRRLIEDESATFKEKVIFYSMSYVSYERGNVLIRKSSNALTPSRYVTMLRLHGRASASRSMFSIPLTIKVEDSFFWVPKFYTPGLPKKDYRESYFILTQGNYLKQYDFENGSLLYEVYLSSSYRYNGAFPDEGSGRIVLKSTRSSRIFDGRSSGWQSTNRRSEDPDIILAMAIVSLTPWKFEGCFTICKSVFGKTAFDVVPDEGTIMVLHTGGIISIYSLDHILEKKMFDVNFGECFEVDGEKLEIGIEPVGLPVNIKLDECPPKLFQVVSPTFQFHLGGPPWHFITARASVYEICNANSKEILENGTLISDVRDLEPDQLMFHPDCSTRIIQSSSHYVHIHRIEAGQLKTFLNFEASNVIQKHKPKINHNEMEKDREFLRYVKTRSKSKDKYLPPHKRKLQYCEKDVTVTRAGRVVKNSNSYDPGFTSCEITYCYEDDLNIFAILLAQGVDNDQATYLDRLFLYDNTTGKKVKVINIGKYIRQCIHVAIVSVIFDFEFIAITVRLSSGSCTLIIFQLLLDQNTNDENIIQTSARMLKRKCKKQKTEDLK